MNADEPRKPDSDREAERRRGVLLEDLPRALRGEADPAAFVGRLLKGLEGGCDWKAVVGAEGGRSRKEVEYFPELAARLLALGYVHDARRIERDPLLWPDTIDKGCLQDDLTSIRAVLAIELQSSRLLVRVIQGRMLCEVPVPAAEGPTTPPDHAKIFRWLDPLLGHEVAQCLLINGLASTVDLHDDRSVMREDMAFGMVSLTNHLIDLYGWALASRPGAPSFWDDGPLAGWLALGHWLREPYEDARRGEFVEAVQAWKGWSDEARWPVRHPGGDLAGLKAALTERLAAALGLEDRKLWRDLPRDVVELWPPLGPLSLGAAPAPQASKPKPGPGASPGPGAAPASGRGTPDGPLSRSPSSNR